MEIEINPVETFFQLQVIPQNKTKTSPVVECDKNVVRIQNDLGL
jgi:hypothetical protein